MSRMSHLHYRAEGGLSFDTTELMFVLFNWLIGLPQFFMHLVGYCLLQKRKKTYLSRYNARWADEDIEMQASEPKLVDVYRPMVVYLIPKLG